MIQTLGARFSHGLISLFGSGGTLAVVARVVRRTRRLPIFGHCGDVAGRRRSSGALSFPHSALAPSGQAVWTEMAVRSARALVNQIRRPQARRCRDILTDASIQNAMALHAAFGGSTNLLLHIPAIARAAKLKAPTVDDWIAVNRRVPRLVSVLPNGPVHHPTVRVFLAGGVPEVMLHLRALGLLETDALTVSGKTLSEVLDGWEKI